MQEKTIRVCVIDDEPIACRRIQRLLKEDPEMRVVHTCNNGPNASQAIQDLLPDLIFLDIQMPEMDGFEVLQSLDRVEKPPHVIFVTAYDQYAVRAFEVHAMDYLLKPFDKKRFHTALKRAKDHISQDRTQEFKHDLLSLMKEIKPAQPSPEHLMIKSEGKVYFLKTDTIDWIESSGKYVTIHAGRETHVIREAMNNLETELEPTKFLRIHKSSIVNIDRIEHLQPLFHGDYRVFLHDGTTLTVSRRYRLKLDEIFGKPL